MPLAILPHLHTIIICAIPAESCFTCKQLCWAAKWQALWARIPISHWVCAAECAVTWVHLHSGASAVEGCEPDKEHKADFAGKLRLHVCLHPAPLVKVLLGRSCSFLPATCALLPAILHRRTVSGLSHPLEEADVWFRSREGCMFVVSLGLCFRGCFGPW